MRHPVFDIDVRSQRETSYSKMSQNELAVQFMQMGVFNPQLTDQTLMMLDMMEFKGKEELSQKIAESGTMAQALQQYQQIALALAQQYEPETAEELAGAIMGQAPQMGGSAQTPKAQDPAQSAAARLNDATANAEKESQESAMNRRMRERVANATRPD